MKARARLIEDIVITACSERSRYGGGFVAKAQSLPCLRRGLYDKGESVVYLGRALIRAVIRLPRELMLSCYKASSMISGRAGPMPMILNERAR